MKIARPTSPRTFHQGLFPVLVGTFVALISSLVPAQRHDPGIVIGPRGERLGRTDRFDLAVGGAIGNPFGPQVMIAPMPNNVFQVTLGPGITGTAWDEVFLLGIPQVPLAPGAPLLVAFHGYGNSERDIVVNTDYFRQAMDRGWYVLAPLGAHKYNFAIDYAQENVHAAIDYVNAHFSIDPERVYGVGFSMGGGGALNYAERYLDPRDPMMAAVVDHTGTVSIRHDYANSFNTYVFDHPEMFGGPPSSDPFRYQTASSIDLDPVTDVIDLGSDLFGNLAHVPVRVWIVQQEPLAHLLHQTQRLVAHAATVSVGTVATFAPGNQHAWSTLDETAVLDWLDAQRLTLPSPGQVVDVLADRDARYFHFDVTQTMGGSFSPFRWFTDQPGARITVDNIENISNLAFDPAEVGLDKTQTFEVTFMTVPGGAFSMTLKGLSGPPTDVRRDGLPTSSWSYDAGTGCLTLDETASGTNRTWSIEP